jgi:hypothetical protein
VNKRVLSDHTNEKGGLLMSDIIVTDKRGGTGEGTEDEFEDYGNLDFDDVDDRPSGSKHKRLVVSSLRSFLTEVISLTIIGSIIGLIALFNPEGVANSAFKVVMALGTMAGVAALATVIFGLIWEKINGSAVLVHLAFAVVLFVCGGNPGLVLSPAENVDGWLLFGKVVFSVVAVIALTSFVSVAFNAIIKRATRNVK